MTSNGAKKASAASTGSGQKLKVSIHNETAMPAAYFVSDKIYAAAAKKYPGTSERFDVRFFEDANSLPTMLEDTEILIASLMGGNLPLTHLLEAPALRWVHFIGSGVDHLLPLDWLPRGAILTKSLGAHLPNAAEYALTALLMLNNNIPFYTSSQRLHRWDRVFSTSIRGKTVAIVGVGTIGGAVASAARQAGLKTLGVRRSGAPHKDIDQMFTPDRLDDVLSQADFVYLSTALTPSTQGMIGKSELAKMKPGAGLVSIARGAVIDFDALADALRSGHLCGAVVNAFKPEPLPETSFLWDVPNLIITPHVGTQDRQMFPHNVLDIFFSNAERYLKGDQLQFQVDPDRGY